MNGAFTLLRTQSRDVPCLSVVGDLANSAALELFASALHDLIFDASRRARVDLSVVTAFGASGLGVLSAAAEVAAPREVVLLIETSPPVRRVLESAGLTIDS